MTKKNAVTRLFAFQLLGAAVLSVLVVVLLAPGAKQATQNPQVTAPQGMVASAHALASQAGVEILKAGGNAVDAAVAAAFAIGVVEPNSNGIGGEGMMVIYLVKGRKAVAIDYRSAAPALAAYPERIPSAGCAAAAVPGTVAGLSLALEKYGTMPLGRVLEPAIKLASDGFAISSTLATIIVDNFEAISQEESLSKIFCPDGLPLEAGDTLRNPDLAETLRKIAAGGSDVFYSGEFAEKIDAEMRIRGGFITKKDLAGYRAIEREPVRGRYRGYDLVSAPPPVGGLAVVEIMQILENFKLARYRALAPQRIHLMAEAMKRGMADWRTFVGDPDFVNVPTTGLLSRKYAKARATEIDPDRISEKTAAGDPAKGLSPSTTSLSAVDAEGNMVALTQTISDFFGAKVMVAGTGIILNNEMKNFSARGVNAMAPGKRMRTTISPTILTRKGKAFATIGTPGAARILTTMPLLISNLIDYKMGIQEAIEMPRFFPSGKDLMIEPRLPEETVAALVKMGYNLEPQGEFDLFFGGAQGIIIDPKTRLRVGGADPRRDGAVVGY
jgi:gamma-glutamyltranspeptidase/glutathione hydrolase